MSRKFERLSWLIDDGNRVAELLQVANPQEEEFLTTVAELARHQVPTNKMGMVSRRLGKYLSSSQSERAGKSLKIAFLCNGTLELALEHLPLAAIRHDLMVESLCIQYDQAKIACMEGNSELESFGPDIIVMAFDYRMLPLMPHSREAATAAIEHVRELRKGLSTHYAAQIIIQNFAYPPETWFGNSESQISGNWASTLDALNADLIDLAAKFGDSLLDIKSLSSRVGTEAWFDREQWFAHKLPFDLELAPAYCEMLSRLFAAIRGKSRKCLVLDLDNTVWGGVIGDDGLSGIEIGHGSSLGEAHLDLQRYALGLRDRGVILAVCSKNTDEVAREPFREHPDMILRENHITVFQANWRNKSDNLRAIAEFLNIGLDALVFLDDNPMERAAVRSALPMVAVPEIGDDPSDYTWILSAAGYFESTSFSSEDKERALAYEAEAKRVAARDDCPQEQDYLTSLEMEISFAPFNAVGRSRITQLINKTNQFNLTTKRYTEAEVEVFETESEVFTLQSRLRDRFGESGMIGVVIAIPVSSSTWEIDSWLMSCRVLGRHVEIALLTELVRQAKLAEIRFLVGTYIPTAKNAMVADHYLKLGFEEVGDSTPDVTKWCLDISEWCEPELPMVVKYF